MRGNGVGTMESASEMRLHLRVPSAFVMRRLTALLEREGLRVYRSFDLQAALSRLPECGCPYHGQATCTCQYAVWLVYGRDAVPVLVILHGRDDETWITISTEGKGGTGVRDVLTNISHIVRESLAA